jgi:hypothetical protein
MHRVTDSVDDSLTVIRLDAFLNSGLFINRSPKFAEDLPTHSSYAQEFVNRLARDQANPAFTAASRRPDRRMLLVYDHLADVTTIGICGKCDKDFVSRGPCLSGMTHGSTGIKKRRHPRPQ